MKYNILLLCIFTILLYITPSMKVFFNEPLGKIIVLFITLYYFTQSPLLGILFIVLFLTIKDRYVVTTPLNVFYKTSRQTPASPISDSVIKESGLELLSKETYLRSKDSNTYSMVVGSPTVCLDNDILCLYENHPKAYESNLSTKLISKYN